MVRKQPLSQHLPSQALPWLSLLLPSAHVIGSQDLRVDLRDFQGQTSYAKYSSFQVSGEQEKYKLTLGQFLGGTAGKSRGKLEAVVMGGAWKGACKLPLPIWDGLRLDPEGEWV